MRRYLAGILSVTVLIGAAGCLVPPPTGALDDLDQPVQDFALTERSGRTVRLADLQGKVWVADFIFTRCTGACPQVSGTLARLQAELAGKDDVRLVSFSVDPEHDTPEVLRKYAERHGADLERWLFLTGKQDEIYPLIRTSFLLAVEQNTGTARTAGNEVTHSPRLALVDRKGHVRGWFDGRLVDQEGQPVDDLPRLKQRIDALLRERP